MAFARKRDTVCPGQKLTQLEGSLLGRAKRTVGTKIKVS
jgi:hypothetical protein